MNPFQAVRESEEGCTLDLLDEAHHFLQQAWQWATHKKVGSVRHIPPCPDEQHMARISLLCARAVPARLHESLDRLLSVLWWVWSNPEMKVHAAVPKSLGSYISQKGWHRDAAGRKRGFLCVPFDTPAGTLILHQATYWKALPRKGMMWLPDSRSARGLIYSMNTLRPYWRAMFDAGLPHPALRGLRSLFDRIVPVASEEKKKRKTSVLVHQFIPFSQRARRIVYLYHEGLTAEQIEQAWSAPFQRYYRRKYSRGQSPWSGVVSYIKSTYAWYQKRCATTLGEHAHYAFPPLLLHASPASAVGPVLGTSPLSTS